MNTLKFVVRAAVLPRLLSPMGSLCGSPRGWADLCEVAHDGEDYPEAILDAASGIAYQAVPEEGEIHPQRAGVARLASDAVEFLTPGGVRVVVSAAKGGHPGDRMMAVAIDFGRDSRCLSWEILAALHTATAEWDAVVSVDCEDMFLAEAIAAAASRGLEEDLAVRDAHDRAKREYEARLKEIAAGPRVEGLPHPRHVGRAGDQQ